MPTLKVNAHGGINRIFPQHKLSGKDVQKVQELQNMLDLFGKTYIIGGASRIAQTALSSDVKWAKRIYYNVGGDNKKDQFIVSSGKIYKLDESTGTMNQSLISNSGDIALNTNFYPVDCSIKIGEQVSTFMVDGTYFYKFNGNQSGAWDRLPVKLDVDGNTIYPIYIIEYLDRLWCLVKDKNVLLGSKNLNPESFNDATDSILINLPSGKGGFPTGLIVMNGFLTVIHEDYFVPVTGSSPSTFGVRPGDFIHGFGTRAPRSILNLKTEFAFLNSSDNEIYTSGGTLGSTNRIPLSLDIHFNSLVNPVLANLTVLHYDTNLRCIRVGYVLTGESLLNAEEIYSIDEKKWCGQTRNRNISCYCQWIGKNDDGRLMTGRSDTGLLMWNDASLNFDGIAIHYRWVSASYMSDDEISDLEFERFYLDGKSLGNFNIQIGYYLDTRLTTAGTESVNMQGEITTLGFVEFAEQDIFLNPIVPLIDKCRGRMIRFQIEGNQLNTVLEFYGIYAVFNKQEAKTSKYIYGG